MLRFYLAALLLTASLLNVATAEEKFLPTTKLGILDYVVIAEVADVPSARETGLMYRTRLPESSGMLFVFPVASIQCMWMKNTPIPLSVAFLDEVKKIINLAEMVPETLTPHCSSGAAKYALEMSRSWFEVRKVKVGDHVIEITDADSIRQNTR